METMLPNLKLRLQNPFQDPKETLSSMRRSCVFPVLTLPSTPAKYTCFTCYGMISISCIN